MVRLLKQKESIRQKVAETRKLLLPELVSFLGLFPFTASAVVFCFPHQNETRKHRKKYSLTRYISWVFNVSFVCLFTFAESFWWKSSPSRQGSSAVYFLGSLLCKKYGLQRTAIGLIELSGRELKCALELIRPASVNDRRRAKDLASEKLQCLSGRRSGELSTICF